MWIEIYIYIHIYIYIYVCIYHASTRVNLKDFVKAWLNRVSGGMTAKIGLQKAKKNKKGRSGERRQGPTGL